jgi:Fic family protein
MPMPGSDRAEREVENGFRQFDLCLEIIRYYLDPERPFALRPAFILDLQKEAVDGVESAPGKLRSSSVIITGSGHVPPAPHLVAGLIHEFCDYINDNWHERTAFHLAAYALWRLNWIHPFSDGNGRTARAVSYMLLCMKLGYVLPGSPTIPQQIEEAKAPYIHALERADAAERDNRLDVADMEEMLKAMLVRQLIGIIEAAGGGSVTEG